ncbi:hypothetical protein B0H11DRAFT_1898072 [Mycena galericulata]|nr:hypothetical protein B0H11DRAFT_1898072 [Mycena galericulata]
MFPTRARAMTPTRLRRQTTAPPPGGGMFNLKTPAGKNNAVRALLLAAIGTSHGARQTVASVAALTLLGASYYLGYWGTYNEKDGLLIFLLQATTPSVKKD